MAAGGVTIESFTGKMTAPGPVDVGANWTPVTTIAVPPDATTDYFAGIQFGTLRARISEPVTGGSVTVVAVRPEEQRGMVRPRF